MACVPSMSYFDSGQERTDYFSLNRLVFIVFFPLMNDNWCCDSQGCIQKWQDLIALVLQNKHINFSIYVCMRYFFINYIFYRTHLFDIW